MESGAVASGRRGEQAGPSLVCLLRDGICAENQHHRLTPDASAHSFRPAHRRLGRPSAQKSDSDRQRRRASDLDRFDSLLGIGRIVHGRDALPPGVPVWHRDGHVRARTVRIRSIPGRPTPVHRSQRAASEHDEHRHHHRARAQRPRHRLLRVTGRPLRECPDVPCVGTVPAADPAPWHLKVAPAKRQGGRGDSRPEGGHPVFPAVPTDHSDSDPDGVPVHVWGKRLHHTVPGVREKTVRVGPGGGRVSLVLAGRRLISCLTRSHVDDAVGGAQARPSRVSVQCRRRSGTLRACLDTGPGDGDGARGHHRDGVRHMDPYRLGDDPGILAGPHGGTGHGNLHGNCDGNFDGRHDVFRLDDGEVQRIYQRDRDRARAVPVGLVRRLV